MSIIKGKAVQSTTTITIDGFGDVVQHVLTTDKMRGSIVVGMEVVNTGVKYRFVNLRGSYHQNDVIDLPMCINLDDGEYYISNYPDLTQLKITEFELIRRITELEQSCVMVSEREGKSYYMTSPPDISSCALGRTEYVRISSTVALAKAGVFIPLGISILLVDGPTPRPMFDYNPINRRIIISTDLVRQPHTNIIRDEFNKSLADVLPVLEDDNPLIACPYLERAELILNTSRRPYPLSKE